MLISVLFLSFSVIQFVASKPQAGDPCHPTPCGANSKCRVEEGRAICSCQTTFIGNPIKGCRHECESDSDCSRELGCINFRCKDPCLLNACAAYAICTVIDQKPDCKCPPDYNGDGYTICFPECSSHADCPANRACIGHKCGDPCAQSKTETCGKNALCKVNTESHKAICRCPSGWKGHPFEACYPPGGKR